MIRSAVVALGLLVCAPRQTEAQGAATDVPAAQVSAGAQIEGLGSLERRALELALRARGLEVEPAPAGKTLRLVHVVNLPVFGPEDGFLAWFNVFHRTSREYMVRREVLVEPGQPWVEDRVDETRRRLRDPLFSTLAVIVPVRAAGDGQVDMLVVTRDIWSLRLNSRYEIQESVLTELSLSLAENNLFGLRKQIAVVFDMNLGSYTIGPQYVDKNIAGTHLQLLSRLDAIFNRYSSEFEGTQSYNLFAYPLWSLDREWGASIEMAHFDGIRRAFLGPDIRTYTTAEGAVLPWEYDERDLDIETTVTRQLGQGIKHRISAGHRLDVQRPEVRDVFPGDQAARDEFEAEVLPRSERSSAAFLRYTMFTPIYTVYRNLDSFDLAEDQRLGPELIVEGGSALEALGSEVDFLYGSLSAAWALDLAGDGLVRASAGTSARRQDGETIDILRTATLIAAAPRFFGLRLAGRATWSRRYDETSNRFFTLGGDSGLRGYTIGAFAGTGANPVRALFNLELRSQAVPIWVTRVGALLFYDAGHAANCYRGCERNFVIHQDVGAGFRVLIPHLQPYVFRFDWALPLTGSTAGFPGRFIAGVNQIF